jgi:hypothetical protein
MNNSYNTFFSKEKYEQLRAYFLEIKSGKIPKNQEQILFLHKGMKTWADSWVDRNRLSSDNHIEAIETLEIDSLNVINQDYFKETIMLLVNMVFSNYKEAL